ncbi:hypothetical protein ACFLXE_00180 [Chloroflexota bacterium]
MPDLLTGSNTLKSPFTKYPRRLYVPNGDGSYSPKVIAEGRTGALATEATLQSVIDTLKSMTEAAVDAGVPDDNSTVNVLNDAEKNWPVNEFEKLLIEVVYSDGSSEIRKIQSNTATSITPSAAFSTAPDTTCTYRIAFFGKVGSDITHWGGTALTGRDVSTDLSKLDIALSTLRDNLRGASSKDLTTLETAVAAVQTSTDALRTAKTIDDIETAVLALRTAKNLDDIVTAVEALRTTSTLDTLEADVAALLTGIVLAAGTNLIGKVGIDQTTPGTTDKVTANVSHIGGTALTGRDISADLKALVDDSIKGILKSIGDIATTENLITRIGATDSAVVDAGAVGSVAAKIRRLTTDLGVALTSLGATDAALVDAGAVGSVAAKLRRLTTDLGAALTSLGLSDAALVDAGAVGAVQSKLRRLTTDLSATLGLLNTAITDGAIARQDTASGILAAFEPKTNYGSSTGAALTVDLDCGFTGGKTEVDVWVKSSAAATFKVFGSKDNSNWRQFRRFKYTDDSMEDVELVLAGVGEEHIHIKNAFRYLRVTTSDANNNEAEIATSR